MTARYDHFKKRINFKNILKDILFIYIIAIITVLLFNTLIIQAYKVPSNSMEPQIIVNTSILVNKFIYGPKFPLTDNRIFNNTKNIKRGNVIVFMSNEYINKNKFFRLFSNLIYTFSFSYIDLANIDKNSTNLFVKRVIGLPGDVIKYKLVDNKVEVFINNIPEKKVIDLNYDVIEDNDQFPLINEYRVPDEEYYVLGDNRKKSVDSRIWGSIKSKQIIGKAVVKYWHWPFISSYLGVIK